jgi:hypothetical protein
MSLFSALSRPAQAQVATPSNTNDLGSQSFVAILADALNPPNGLPNSGPRGYPAAKALPTPASRRSSGRTRARRVQLNVDVSGGFKARLRAAAKRHGCGMGALVETWCSEALDRERQ